MVDDSKDRGNKKWSMAMIRPKHAQFINKRGKERKQVERKLKDIELAIMMNELEVAFKRQTTIKVTYSRDRFVKDDYGKIISIDPHNKAVVLENPFGTNWYSCSEIVAVIVID